MRICQICYGKYVRLAAFSFILRSREVLPVPDHSHEARHRAGHRETSRRPATSRPGRLIAGLALPTAATVALMFCAAGAAVATSAKTPSGVFSQNAAAVTSPEPATAQPTPISAGYLAKIEKTQ